MSFNKDRMKFADFTRTFKNLWGGTKLGMDTHALQRGKERVYPFMSYELLAENIRAIFLSGGSGLEELVMEVQFGSLFTVYDEDSRMAIMASIDFNQDIGVNEVFINTVYVRKWLEPIYCDARIQLMCRVNLDGSITVNPPELVCKDIV